MDRPAAGEDDLAREGRPTEPEVVRIAEPLRRYVHAHNAQPVDTDDIVQETLTRLLENDRALAADSVLAYALVTARHVMADRARETHRHRRHAPRLVDVRQPARPDDVLVDQEERAALLEALADVPATQRKLLLAHILDDEPISSLAVEEGKSQGSLSAQLMRIRSRLRLDYVLALRGTDLPTPRCRPILLALSGGDTRRQEALRAGHHLLTCSTCADLAEPLLQRRRALAAVLPWIGAGPFLGLIRRLWSQRPIQVAAAVTTVAATAGTAALIAGSPTTAAPAVARPTPSVSRSVSATPTPARSGELTRTDDGRPVQARTGQLRSISGQTVSGRKMRVVGVPADEGFWVSNTGNDRVWIQLRTRQGESRVNVDVGDTVSFTGVVRTHNDRFAARIGVDPAEGAALLTHEGAHVVVAVARLNDVHQ